jgi:hypothetical protein
MKTTKPLHLLLLTALLSVLAVACLKDLTPSKAKEGVLQFTIIVEKPENTAALNFDDFDFTILQASLTDQQGRIIIAQFDAEGVARIDIDPGFYNNIVVSAEFSLSEDDPDNLVFVNGVTSAILLTEAGIVINQDSIDEPIRYIKLSATGGEEPEIPLVIREVYWGGDRHVIAGRTYAQDQYIEIYNNGRRDVIIDSLFIGVMRPYNSTVPRNGWWGRDTIGLAPNMFMIPARRDGQPRILKSGESVVIAMASAIDLRGVTQNALRLDRVHFHLWHPEFTMRETTPGVERLQRVSDVGHQGTAGIFSVSSPAVIIYRIPNFHEYFVRDREKWQGTDPASNSVQVVQHIHVDWIIDGVECFANPSDLAKRLPHSVDASFTWLPGGRLEGNAVRRKVQRVRADGTVVYMDTNNSALDFETDVKPNPRLRRD